MVTKKKYDNKEALGIIERLQDQIMRQRDSIGRMLAGFSSAQLKATPEQGVTVLFRLADVPIEYAARDGRGDPINYTIESSEVDSDGRIIVILEAMDV